MNKIFLISNNINLMKYNILYYYYSAIAVNTHKFWKDRSYDIEITYTGGNAIILELLFLNCRIKVRKQYDYE